MPSIDLGSDELRAVIAMYGEYQERPSRDLARAMDKLYFALEGVEPDESVTCSCWRCELAKRPAGIV